MTPTAVAPIPVLLGPIPEGSPLVHPLLAWALVLTPLFLSFLVVGVSLVYWRKYQPGVWQVLSARADRHEERLAAALFSAATPSPRPDRAGAALSPKGGE